MGAPGELGHWLQDVIAKRIENGGRQGSQSDDTEEHQDNDQYGDDNIKLYQATPPGCVS